jgi:hypothetical protein
MQKQEETKKEEDNFAKAFPDLVEFPEESLETQKEEEKTEIFYLWESKKEVFSLFKILRNYLTEWYGFDSALILALVSKRNLDLEEVLLDLPFILQGFLSKLPSNSPKMENPNG